MTPSMYGAGGAGQTGMLGLQQTTFPGAAQGPYPSPMTRKQKKRASKRGAPMPGVPSTPAMAPYGSPGMMGPMTQMPGPMSKKAMKMRKKGMPVAPAQTQTPYSVPTHQAQPQPQ